MPLPNTIYPLGTDVDKPPIISYMLARHMVSILDEEFGVVAGGVADCSPGINAADASLNGAGVVWFPRGVYYVAASIENAGHIWMGEGSGDYTVGGATTITTDDSDLDVVIITGRRVPQIHSMAIVNTAVATTGPDTGFSLGTGIGIRVENSANGCLNDLSVRGFDSCISFLPGAIAPQSCFGWSVVDTEVSGKTFGIDARASTNTLHISHCTLGAQNCPLSVVDSIGLDVDGCTDIEGSPQVGINIDASTTMSVDAKIHCHCEFAADPPLGAIRLGASVKVWGVKTRCHFSGASITVNCLNGSTFIDEGNTVNYGAVVGDPSLLAATSSMADNTGYAFSVVANTAATGSGPAQGFAQRNSAGAFKNFGALSVSAESVTAGNELANGTLRLLIAGVLQDVLHMGFDVNGRSYLDVDYIRLKDGTAAPPVAGGRAALFVDAADGDTKIRYSDSVTKLIIGDT